MNGNAATERRIGLGIETSGMFGSVTLGDGDEIIDTIDLVSPRAHAADFLPAIDRLFRAAAVSPCQIRDVFVSIGPGSFTGLRIGVTAARMIALATGARVVPVPTLDVIAQNGTDEPEPAPSAVVILDAKRKRVYASSYRYESGAYVCQTEAAEVDPSPFLAAQPPECVVLGEGVAAHRETVEASGLRILPDTTYRARAAVVYRLGCTAARVNAETDRMSLVPHYVRLPEAEERLANRKSN